MFNRREQSQRRALQKAAAKSLATLAKGTGWRVSQGVLFREWEGLFIVARFYIKLLEGKTVAELEAKPLDLDPIFWDVMDLAENRRQSLSFRYFGVFVCPMATVAEEPLDEGGGDPNLIALNLLSWANQHLPTVKALVTPYTDYLVKHPNPSGHYRAGLITSLLLDGNTTELTTYVPPRSGIIAILGFRRSSVIAN